MKVLCTLENASDTINGVKFDLVEGVGRLSEDLSDEAAELFLSIPGYERVEGEQKVVEPAKPITTAPTKKATVPTKKATVEPVTEPAVPPKAAADALPAGDDDTTF